MPAQKPSKRGRIFFYPPEFYVFDNFSAFQIEYRGKSYPTVEHAYHSLKFAKGNVALAEKIRGAKSAHEALKISEKNAGLEDPGFKRKKLQIMNGVGVQIIKEKTCWVSYGWKFGKRYRIRLFF